MRRKYHYRQIISCKVYTTTMICDLLNVHRRTVQNWIRIEGLKIKNPGGKPLVIEGADLKKFLKVKLSKYKITLKYNEFRCGKCKKAVKSKDGIIKAEMQDKYFGHNNRQIILKGICEHCFTKLSRLSSTNNLIQLGLFNKVIRA